MILGLTGGIGSGKSTISKIFLSMNLKVFDADIIAKEILNRNDIKEEIREKLGNEFIVVNEENNLVATEYKKIKNIEIDKIKLKKAIFSDERKRNILNNIIHPKVEEEYKKISEEYIDKDEIVVFDIPLLFEAHLEKYCTKILNIDAETDVQIDRIKKRDGLSDDMIKKIINSQSSREEKNRKASFVIKNDGTILDLEEKIKEIIIKMKVLKNEETK